MHEYVHPHITMLDHKKLEEDVLQFWQKNQIYEKSAKQNAKGEPFYFMDGPPYATGHIHLGTALNKILKDIAMRSHRLQGCDVFDRPGYDTHGIPIEFQVEKEIGSKSKQDIEKYGVEKFIQKCKQYATQYIGVMNKEFENLGVWMDWEKPYLTLDDEYIESIWAAFKAAEKKGLLYRGQYPVHICTRCETAVAFNEIEYGKQKDRSIYVKFPLKNKKNTSLIIWTTTPWTLPANTGVMANPSEEYCEVEVSEGEHWIIAKNRLAPLMTTLERGFTIQKEFKGKEMEGWEYTNPLTPHLNMKLKNAYKVVLSARYVTTEDGTGLVHCAPGHGKEDYEVGREYGLDAPSPVETNGILTKEAGKYAGKKARVVDTEIIEDLEKDGFLVHTMQYEHDYPLCWRDKSPLLMISQPQWFLKISEIQKKLLAENEKTHWVPDYMKLRMKAWLEGIGDWPVSRQRYWGTPLPIWHDPETGEHIVVGSIDELQKLSGVSKIDMHKPGIDKIVIVSKKTGKKLHRVTEVLDVWFDSGVSSWAALGYPGDEKKFKKYWPADLNIEGKDQFRGWWNSQMILSQITFDKKPFESISVHGMILDISKRKMSKSVGNIISPEDVIKKYGRDYMRYFFAKISKGDDFSFDENEFKEIQKVFTVIFNLNTFINQCEKTKGKQAIEDTWILSRYNSLVRDVTKAYTEYRFPEVIRKLEEFIVTDLSRTYIQMIRDRSHEVYNTLHEIRLGLLQLLAPVCPFITEHIWQTLEQKEESIHLTLLPKHTTKKIDEDLETQFSSFLKIMEAGMAERDAARIGLRWPLKKAVIVSPHKLDKKIEEILMRQLNVKKVELSTSDTISVSLDTSHSPELEAEGFAREIARNIQAARKKAGLEKSDVIQLEIACDDDVKEMLKTHAEFLKERVNAKSLVVKTEKLSKVLSELQVKNKKIEIYFYNTDE